MSETADDFGPGGFYEAGELIQIVAGGLAIGQLDADQDGRLALNALFAIDFLHYELGLRSVRRGAGNHTCQACWSDRHECLPQLFPVPLYLAVKRRERPNMTVLRVEPGSGQRLQPNCLPDVFNAHVPTVIEQLAVVIHKGNACPLVSVR